MNVVLVVWFQEPGEKQPSKVEQPTDSNHVARALGVAHERGFFLTTFEDGSGIVVPWHQIHRVDIRIPQEKT